MNKFLLIFTLLFSTASFSQIQKRFFVNDVKTVDFVTVNFCVNDSAQINQVTVLTEKTTYQNKEMINKLINYLKSIQYYPDSKLRNNCYDSTFEFVNIEFENAEIKKSNYSKCMKFKTGNFIYGDPRLAGTKIKRTAKKQREKNKVREKENWFKEKYKINWTSPCEYELEFLTANSEDREEYIGKSIKVKIIAFIENGYIFKSKLLDFPDSINVILFDND